MAKEETNFSYPHLSAYEFFARKKCFKKKNNVLPLLAGKESNNQYIRELVHDQLSYLQ